MIIGQKYKRYINIIEESSPSILILIFVLTRKQCPLLTIFYDNDNPNNYYDNKMIII